MASFLGFSDTPEDILYTQLSMDLKKLALL
jgi:hypothetical protein